MIPSQIPVKIVGFKTTAEIAVGTDHYRKLLSTKDWYYSDLHRRLLTEFYCKQDQDVPEEIMSEMQAYDLVSKHGSRIKKVYERDEFSTV